MLYVLYKYPIYLKETSSFVQTTGFHCQRHLPREDSTVCLELLKVETFFLIVSPVCRKFLSKPQKQSQQALRQNPFRQQHDAIYFPPESLHIPLVYYFSINWFKKTVLLRVPCFSLLFTADRVTVSRF